MALIEFGERTVQHGLANDQFTHEVHDGVNTRGIYSQHTFGDSRDGRARATIFARTGGVFVVGRCGSNFLRLRFKQFTEQLVIGGVGCGSAFDPDFRDDRRNPAALAEQIFRGATGNRCFHNFNCCRGSIVFRTESDHRAATMQYVSNKLEGGGAHHAVRINAQGDVVYGFTAVQGF